jgi:hypothetical protein
MRCPNNHELSVVNGRCPECNRGRQATHRHRNVKARNLVDGLCALGVRLDVMHLAEGHRLVTALDMARHPWIENT